MKGDARDQIIEYLLEDKLNATQIGRIVGCHPGYVRSVKQRYITAPEREKLRAKKRDRKRQERLMRDPVYRAQYLVTKRKSWWKNRDHYNAKSRARYLAAQDGAGGSSVREEIPKAIQDRLDEMRAVYRSNEAHERACGIWYRMQIPALGKSPKECVEEGKEEAVLKWMDAWKHRAYA